MADKADRDTSAWLDKHGDALIDKVVQAEGPSAATAASHLFRTLVEFCVPKPESKLKVEGFGSVHIDVGKVE